MGMQMAHGSRSAPALLVRTVRTTHRLESGPEYRIGRDERADIAVNDPRVSWDHAVLYAVGDGWVLEDRGSRNGTFLGAEKISRLDITGPCVIHVGNPEDGPVLRIEVEQVAEAPPLRPRRRRPPVAVAARTPYPRTAGASSTPTPPCPAWTASRHRASSSRRRGW